MPTVVILFIGILIGGAASLFGIYIAQRRERKLKIEEEEGWIQTQIRKGFLKPATMKEACEANDNVRPMTPLLLSNSIRNKNKENNSD